MTRQLLADDAAQVCSRLESRGLPGKTVLVTGASGLMGTHFLSCLAHWRKQGLPLKVYAQVLSEPAPHVTNLVRDANFELLRLDLSDFAAYAQLPEADLIIHAAGYGQPARFMANPGATLQINTSATLALLQRLRRGGRFLYLSSSEVYSGLAKAQPHEEDIGTTAPSHPRAAYIEGKRSGEAICYAFRAQGVAAVVARLALAYGPGTRPHDRRVLNSFIEQALRQRSIQLLDQGLVQRTYVYATDAIYMLWRLLLEGREPCYNVGGASKTTIADLARLIGNTCRVPVIVPRDSNRGLQGAPPEVGLDLSRFVGEFGPVPFLDLPQGVARTVQWQRALYA